MAIANQLVKIQLKAEQIWTELKQAQGVAGGTLKHPALVPNIGTLSAILEESGRTRINQVYSDNPKKRTVEVWHPVLNCDISTTADKPANCSMSYPTVDTTPTTYNLTRGRNQGFSIAERAWETNPLNADETAAEQMLMCEKMLLEDTNSRLHSLINDDANLTPYDDGRYTLNGADNTVEIPMTQATPRIFSYLMLVSKKLGMVSPFLLYGGSLMELYMDVMLSTTDPTGASGAKKMNLIRGYEDFTMDATLSEEKFFLIDRGVWSIINRPDWWHTTPRSMGGDRECWSRNMTMENRPIGMNSQNGRPVTLKVDAYHKLACQNNNDILHNYALDLNVDGVKAPNDACADNYTPGGGPYTGVVAFRFV